MAESKEKAVFSPKISKPFTTHPKNGKRRKNRKSIFEDSTAKSSLSTIEEKLGINDLFSGKIKHLNFDCPPKLRDLFKEATKANGTSVCKELQKYALSYSVKYVLEKQSFGSTMSKVLSPSLTIENLNFEQYTQSRPRRYIRQGSPEFLTDDGLSTCEVGNCHNEAIESGVFIKTEKKYRLCKLHYENCLDNPKVWRLSK
jgi:hypothetical protein